MMSDHGVCPWWIGWLLASPLRRLWNDPDRIIDGHVKPGMIVLERGPGMGFFTLELAKRVGDNGRVIAIDQQPQMIGGLEKRARKAGLAHRIDARVCPPHSMELGADAGQINLTFAVAVVHEMPDAGAFFREVAAASKPGARLLLAEPAGHVAEALFETELGAAEAAGLWAIGTPTIKGCRTALFERRAMAD